MDELNNTRSGLFCCFLTLGFAMASWIVRTPSLRDTLHASTGMMGMVLFGFSVGSMCGILAASQIVRCIGTRKSVLSGLTSTLCGLAVMGTGAMLSSSIIAGVGLAFLGLGMAISEVAVNIIGVEVEQGLNRSVLTVVHGCYSFGTVLGAISGMLFVSLGLPITIHMSLTCLLIVPAIYFVYVNTRHAVSPVDAEVKRSQGTIAFIKQNPGILLVGLIVFSVAIAEGAANDWLPLIVVDSFSVTEKSGSLIFVVFASVMTLGRFCGGFFLKAFGPVRIMRVCGIICAAGIIDVIYAPNLFVTTIGVIMWAAGASLGFPVAMSEGSGNSTDQAASVSILAIIGYTAFLVGPPMLGFVGEHVGLKMAMSVVVVLLMFPIVFSTFLVKVNTSIAR